MDGVVVVVEPTKIKQDEDEINRWIDKRERNVNSVLLFNNHIFPNESTYRLKSLLDQFLLDINSNAQNDS